MNILYAKFDYFFPPPILHQGTNEKLDGGREEKNGNRIKEGGGGREEWK